MGIVMRTEKTKKIGLFLAAIIMGLTLVFPVKTFADESVVIRNVNLKFDSKYGDQEILMPEVTTTTSGVTIQDTLWNRDISKWKAAKSERVSVYLNSDTMAFADTYNRSKCKITGANFVSAKAVDNHTLEIKVDYTPVVRLDNTARAGWSDSTKTKAVWDKVEFATGYQVALYADDKLIKRISVGTNVVNLSEYMNKDAIYYYEVRAVGYTSSDRKYLKEGEYVTSEDIFMEYEGDTSGRWKGNTYLQEDGGVPRNSWKQILNDWYYFDGNGNRQIGWLFSGQRWYYLDINDGKLLTGWRFVNEKWYYLNPTGGEMLTGWVQLQPNVWYYLYPDGSMASNTNIDGYWLDATGKWITG